VPGSRLHAVILLLFPLSLDNTLAISTQVRERFGETLETSAFYAFTRARDQMSLVNFVTRQNLEQTPLDGTPENRAGTEARFSRVTAVAIRGSGGLMLGCRRNFKLPPAGLPSLRNVSDFEGRWSRWLAELGVRYVF
jgi:hypothetical protein